MTAAWNRLPMGDGLGYYSEDMDQQGLDRALAALRGRASEMVAMTRAWVEINSYTENVAGVNAVGEKLAEAFAFLPAQRKRGALGDHWFWRSAAAGAGPPILLIGHHDTVFPPGHFEGWREDGAGRAVGPGALDMKGGLAILRAVLVTLHEAGALAEIPLVVASVGDEEIGSPDSRAHLEAAARGAACALVFESGRPGDVIVTQRRGVGAMRVRAEGRAAHAGNAHREGVNAIWALAGYIDAAQRLTDYARGLTVNVGMIKGGTSKNTVPAQAECAIDIRFETVADAERLVAALVELSLRPAVAGATLRVDGGVSRLPLERTAASAALYQEYAACARAAGLGAGEAGVVGGGSDANTVGALGVPAIDALGPRGEGYHTTGEHVELASFVPKAEALLRFLWGRRRA
jgi:glutamate carboxypeptidase